MKFYYLFFAILLFSCGSNELTQTDVEDFINSQIPSEKELAYSDKYIFRFNNVTIENIGIINFENEYNINTTAFVSFDKVKFGYYYSKNAELNFKLTKSSDKKWYLKDVTINIGGTDRSRAKSYATQAWEEEIESKNNRIPI